MKEIPLTQGKVALVDDEFFEALSQFKWCAYKHCKTFYAIRTIRLPNGKTTTTTTTKSMHREVWKLSGRALPEQLDHIDRDGLNNQLDNLRPATHAEQQRNQGRRTNNTSGFIGVTWHKDKWQADARINGDKKYLGRFDTALEAALARDVFVKSHYGEFAVLNEDLYMLDAILLDKLAI